LMFGPFFCRGDRCRYHSRLSPPSLGCSLVLFPTLLKSGLKCMQIRRTEFILRGGESISRESEMEYDSATSTIRHATDDQRNEYMNGDDQMWKESDYLGTRRQCMSTPRCRKFFFLGGNIQRKPRRIYTKESEKKIYLSKKERNEIHRKRESIIIYQ